MTEDQSTNIKKKQKLSPKTRFVAGLIFFVILLGFYVLRASSKGDIDLSYWLGVCGFKQRFGLPCPGCGWTHAAQLFVTGHLLEAFKTQPAAAFFCFLLLLGSIFALLSAVFGINFCILKPVFSSKGVSVLLVVACIIILAGWMVNLIRTILEN